LYNKKIDALEDKKINPPTKNPNKLKPLPGRLTLPSSLTTIS
jgi:hypothetical protein